MKQSPFRIVIKYLLSSFFICIGFALFAQITSEGPIQGTNNSGGPESKTGVKGIAAGNGYLYGVYGYASGFTASVTSQNAYGVFGYADTGNKNKYGVYGKASGNNGTKYGIYGNATGSGINYAGYFDGDVYAEVLGVNTLTPTETLDINGNARIRAVGSGAFKYELNLANNGVLTTSTSDRRLKQDIHKLQNSLDKTLALRGVSYRWKSDPSETRIGLIAQEVEAVLPEVVFTNEVDGYMGVRYKEIVALLIEAIKEQQKQIDELKESLIVDN